MSETRTIRPAPIRKQLRVKASPQTAFDTFAAMGGWWVAGHSVIAQLQQTTQQTVVIEPREGGRWYEVGGNGNEYDWGRVLVWDPPHRLVLCWQLGPDFTFDPQIETTVEASFTADGDHTIVRFEHRDLERFGDAAAPLRDGMAAGWGALLDGYAAALG
jgi:uncharacterized protein YndB with AHSA1/START domain